MLLGSALRPLFAELVTYYHFKKGWLSFQELQTQTKISNLRITKAKTNRPELLDTSTVKPIYQDT